MDCHTCGRFSVSSFCDDCRDGRFCACHDCSKKCAGCERSVCNKHSNSAGVCSKCAGAKMQSGSLGSSMKVKVARAK